MRRWHAAILALLGSAPTDKKPRSKLLVQGLTTGSPMRSSSNKRSCSGIRGTRRHCCLPHEAQSRGEA